MLKKIVQWLRINSVMLINASSLVGTTAVTSGLGFVYWWVAAKWFLPEAVGVASASVSAMMLLGGMSIIGLGTLLITELPRQPERAGSMISTALIVVGVAGTAIGLLFAFFAPYISQGYQPLRASVVDMLTFAISVGFTAMSLVLDQALVGLLKGTLQFWRNAFFAVIKLAAFFIVAFWPSNQEGMKIYATWMVSTGLSLAFVAINVPLRQRWRRKSYIPDWSLLHKLKVAAFQHHFLNLTLQAPTLLLPVVVTIFLSARMNAWFYVSWMIVSFAFMIPSSLTTVLHAMNAAKQTTLGHKARLTIGIGIAVSIAANIVLQLATQQVLGLFGKSYALEAASCLRMLSLAAFPLVIKNHYISICRIQDKIAKAVYGMLPGGLFELALAAFGAHVGGLFGLSLGWIIAIYVEGAFMFPTVYQVVRSVQPAQATEGVHPLEEVWKQDTVLILSAASSSTGVEAVWLLDTLLMPAIKTAQARNLAFTEEASQPKPKRLPHLKPARLQRYVPPLEASRNVDVANYTREKSYSQKSSV